MHLRGRLHKGKTPRKPKPDAAKAEIDHSRGDGEMERPDATPFSSALFFTRHQRAISLLSFARNT